MTDKNANTEYRKEFCPNCEAETPCTHEAELFVCDICGEDFAKYIVSRNCNVSDVSMTQDVLTDIKTPRSIENKLTDTEACNARLVEQVEQLTAELAEARADAERLAKFQYEHSVGVADGEADSGSTGAGGYGVPSCVCT